jgi:hypothetical protein
VSCTILASPEAGVAECGYSAVQEAYEKRHLWGGNGAERGGAVPSMPLRKVETEITTRIPF